MNPLTWLLDLIYPPKCVVCHKLLESSREPVCQHCMDNLPEHLIRTSLINNSFIILVFDKEIKRSAHFPAAPPLSFPTQKSRPNRTFPSIW